MLRQAGLRSVALIALVVLGACSGSSHPSTRRDGTTTTWTAPPAPGVSVQFAPDTPKTTAELGPAADIISARVRTYASHGDVLSASTTINVDTLTVKTDPALSRAAATTLGQIGAVELRPVVAGTVPSTCGPVNAGAAPPVAVAGISAGIVTPCYLLGAPTSLSAPLTAGAAPASVGSNSWAVVAHLADDDLATARALAATASGRQVALLLDGRVLAAPVFTESGDTELRATPGFDRDTALATAAVLATPALPFALTPKLPAADDRPAIGDTWRARLVANVCGTSIGPAPATDGNIHSHGDGFIMIHPLQQSETGANATLGRFLASGKWSASATSLRLWKGGTKRNGDRCDGRASRVRWWVDRKEQHGDPAAYRPKDGDTIILAFLPGDAKMPSAG